ncbi:hypothetical protein JHK84_042210 [Glycine max]|nr:hypothetical protein JHK84_042210 [Glycine max]
METLKTPNEIISRIYSHPQLVAEEADLQAEGRVLHQEGLDELEREDFLRPANVPDWRNSLYYNPHKAQLLFGHGFHTGMDRHE